jgi:RNA polymerase sigma-70 factor, ECF subfamily
LVEQVYRDEPFANRGWFEKVNATEINSLIGRAQNQAVPEVERRQAFGQVTEHAYGNVLQLAASLTGSEEDAQDVTQEAFRKAWKYIHSFRGDSLFSTWLYQVTINTAKSFRQQRTRRQQIEELGVFGLHVVKDSIQPVFDPADTSPDNDPEKQLEATILHSRLEAALGSIPTKLRAVVVLKEVQDLSHAQIAERLNISESAAKVRLHRARKALRRAVFDT